MSWLTDRGTSWTCTPITTPESLVVRGLRGSQVLLTAPHAAFIAQSKQKVRRHCSESDYGLFTCVGLSSTVHADLFWVQFLLCPMDFLRKFTIEGGAAGACFQVRHTKRMSNSLAFSVLSSTPCAAAREVSDWLKQLFDVFGRSDMVG